MEAKIFSYKVEGVKLETVNDRLKISASFDREGIVNELKDALKDVNFKVDEQSLEHKIVGGQLYIKGLIVESRAQKSMGFMSGK